jgi:hypothetical protein
MPEKPFNTEPKTLQSSAEKPFSRLNPNPLIEPIEEPIVSIYPSSCPFLKSRETRVEDGQFEAFWNVYPRKVARGAAVLSWTRALKLAEPATIIAAAERYAGERAGKDPTYTKHPATWLNHGCWTDEPMMPQPPAPEMHKGLSVRARNRERMGAVIDRLLRLEDE